MSNKPQLQIWTDGGLSKKAGGSSWAFCLYSPELDKTIAENSGFIPTGTSQQGELTAGLQGLLWCEQNLSEKYLSKIDLSLTSDSQYLVKGINQWMNKWKSRGWTKGGDPIKNAHLWKEIFRLYHTLNKPSVLWVKGHSGVPLNEYVDQMCGKVLREVEANAA